ncbi:F-box/LRR-repeat protein 2-like isoform X2 [Penaeus monodon]|uniref:F-box/LRR-repeat protein 2-like isoform X2 n=1 Tax=Penaeus monodon TaxID=6687 RepID=UPI0018A7941B|nr:F-box/LRR-repeat protein 2-like isoform X2 [Penaeus monodon]
MYCSDRHWTCWSWAWSARTGARYRDRPLSLENLGVRNRVPLGSKAEQVIRKEAEVKKYLKENLEQIVNSTEFGLGNLTGLRELNLCGCIKVTDITLTHALHLQELQYLNLSHCQAVGEEGLINLAHQCPSLEVLMLVDCGQTTDQVILVLSHHLKRIKTLDLQRCFKLTDDALDSLSNWHNSPVLRCEWL